MYARCIHCAQKVMVIEDGLCPHCKNKIEPLAEQGARASESKARIPVRVVCAIVIYAVVIIIFVSLVAQFDYDLLSFFLLAVSFFTLAGIVSIVAKRRWARTYNIVLQSVIMLCVLSISTVLVVSGFFSGPGFFFVLAGFGLQAWVTLGFIHDKKLIEYLAGKGK